MDIALFLVYKILLILLFLVLASDIFIYFSLYTTDNSFFRQFYYFYSVKYSYIRNLSSYITTILASYSLTEY